MLDLSAYAGLFLIAFGAATILPVSSDAALVALLLAETQTPWILLTVASVGNVGGSVVNWWLGGQIERFRDQRWFPVKAATLQRARDWYLRWGRWALLLSWTPVVGDALTVAAGVMRERLWVFVALVAIAKTGRYLALAAVTLQFV